jgi:cytoskeletal protein CcmA (bactofilin family)
MIACCRHATPALALALLMLSVPVRASDEPSGQPAESPTNRVIYHQSASEPLYGIGMILADEARVFGPTYDDTFWLITETMELAGSFGNDIWALAGVALLNGGFADHARVAARSVTVDGTISNGLWAAGLSVTITTNAHLYGQHFLLAESLTLLGHVEGDVRARARTITLGGTIVGNLHLTGDDIIIRPGTTVVGDLLYTTTNQTLVLDAHSSVSGVLQRIAPDTTAGTVGLWNRIHGFLRWYWMAGALLTGIAWMLLFPGLNAASVSLLRANPIRCGLIGILYTIALPLLALLALFSLIGLPLGLVAAALAGLGIYLGQFSVALAVGMALTGGRREVSLSQALLALVIGLVLLYGISMIPGIGPTLHSAAGAFGTGSLVQAAWKNRGAVRPPSHPGPQQVDKET